MKKKIATLVIAAMAATGAMSVPAEASPPEQARTESNISCLKSGQAVLRDLGLFQAAAQGEIDYSTLADPVEGPIFAELPEGTFLSINEVFALHRSNSELFAWC